MDVDDAGMVISQLASLAFFFGGMVRTCWISLSGHCSWQVCHEAPEPARLGPGCELRVGAGAGAPSSDAWAGAGAGPGAGASGSKAVKLEVVVVVDAVVVLDVVVTVVVKLPLIRHA
mmetsp:Transcript_111755/g.316106  ORF Transcript_111755/g.316106 Transcript_111755/m.316106 type:complete len:117 (-) Transcript_111755:875-1225(-)